MDSTLFACISTRLTHFLSAVRVRVSVRVRCDFADVSERPPEACRGHQHQRIPVPEQAEICGLDKTGWSVWVGIRIYKNSG